MQRIPLRPIALMTALVLAISAVCFSSVRMVSRWYMATALAERAFERGEQKLVPQLARLDTAAIGPLATAASHADPAVAGPARREIDRLLRQWSQRQSQDASFDGGSRRILLAQELNQRSDKFSPSGQLWLAETAERLLVGDSQFAANVELVQLCDQLLAASQRRTNAIDLPGLPAKVAAKPTPQAPVADSHIAPEDPELLNEWTASQQWSPASLPSGEPRASQGASSPVPRAELVLRSPHESEIAPDGANPEASAEEPYLLRAPTVVRPLAESPPRTAIRALPWESPSPSDPAVKKPTANGPSTFPGRKVIHDPITGLPLALLALSALPDRELLATSLASEDPLARGLLIARGFGGSTRQELTLAIAPSEAERVALVAELLASPTGSAARLLFLLASDDSPRVRAAAIAALGSSPDERLVEAAWQMALRDPDARVARLANEFRPR